MIYTELWLYSDVLPRTSLGMTSFSWHGTWRSFSCRKFPKCRMKSLKLHQLLQRSQWKGGRATLVHFKITNQVQYFTCLFCRNFPLESSSEQYLCCSLFSFYQMTECIVWTSCRVGVFQQTVTVIPPDVPQSVSIIHRRAQSDATVSILSATSGISLLKLSLLNTF